MKHCLKMFEKNKTLFMFHIQVCLSKMYVFPLKMCETFKHHRNTWTCTSRTPGARAPGSSIGSFRINDSRRRKPGSFCAVPRWTFEGGNLMMVYVGFTRMLPRHQQDDMTFVGWNGNLKLQFATFCIPGGYRSKVYGKGLEGT